ncbi:hypothetical protein [Pseudomonas sp. CCI2.4]|uniref:hypothetical protein n=1 Tax=Pseudomonas sp. CCI2.4 TaxID=3048617 RepID=UPI002B230A4E|nr:hypothetical protein [Pseudomonas sp. CCI2.4]MEB0133576.1 hypothetical protein [Pseudomonas sp. CCI2.4]
MASNQRTYQWVGGQIQEARAPYARLGNTRKPRPFIKLPDTTKRKPVIGIQNALLLFTFSSVLMVFAGLGLFAALFVLYAVIFG